jgi:hypothetical protein
LGFVASQPVAVWIGFLVASPIVSSACDARYRRVPTPAWLHARIANHAAAVTIAIYLTGWGPALTGAFAFVALENVSHDGSGTWRVTALWSMLGIAVGQVAVWRGWAPSYLPLGQAEALGLLGAFVLVFVVRMAGATSQQKEEASRRKRLWVVPISSLSTRRTRSWSKRSLRLGSSPPTSASRSNSG